MKSNSRFFQRICCEKHVQAGKPEKHLHIFQIILPFICLGIIWLCSCKNLFQTPPFILTPPECVLSSQTGSFKFVGVKFSVWNMRNSEIKTISAVFSVYEDSNGASPFVGGNPLSGGNIISASLDCSVLPGACGEFEAGLDAYISKVPEKPYYVDFLYLESVGYADGHQWHDPSGAFFVRGKNEKDY